MTRTLAAVTMTALLCAALFGCGQDAPGASSGDGSACTEFVGQEATIGIQHGPGFEVDGPVRAAKGDETSTLGDLVLPGAGSDDAVLSVYESKASSDEPGLDAFAAVSRQVQRTGSGPFNAAVEPLDTTDVEVAGMPAYRATMRTTDDFVYTAWIIPGDERSLDVVLAQTQASIADTDLAEKVPGLVQEGGCG